MIFFQLLRVMLVLVFFSYHSAQADSEICRVSFCLVLYNAHIPPFRFAVLRNLLLISRCMYCTAFRSYDKPSLSPPSILEMHLVTRHQIRFIINEALTPLTGATRLPKAERYVFSRHVCCCSKGNYTKHETRNVNGDWTVPPWTDL